MSRRGVPPSLLLTPLLAVLVLAFSAYDRAAEPGLLFARLYGGPTESEFCGRVQLVEERAGIERVASGRKVSLTWSRGANVVERRLHTEGDGWGDFCMPAPTGQGPGQLGVYAEGQVEPLARGPVSLARARWLASVGRRDGHLTVPGAGPHRLFVELRPPVLSVPFAGELTLTSDSAEPLAISLTAEGLNLGTRVSEPLRSGSPLHVLVRATDHVAVLSLWLDKAAAGEVSASPLQIDIPVLPGSLTFWRDRERLVVASPVEREVAYYSVVGPWGRGPGGRVTLRGRADGTAQGSLALASLPERADRYLVLATEADGRTPGFVGLPLDGQLETFDARDAFLLDGGPGARRRHARDERRLRWVLGGYAAASGLLCLLLFSFHLRRADRTLRLDLSRVGAVPSARDTSWSLPVLAVFSLFFAFSLAVVWIVAR